ncbi:MAG: tricarballylate utilization protein TcuB [Rhodospirillaceae bacterium]|nr:tricarballylate utilization protein TcuB [Rhodospirillaceae bacterium]|tara:strand:- start:1321 stop:2493 length:1173 start_codon:yes stop_codon:yes gene_type:complete
MPATDQAKDFDPLAKPEKAGLSAVPGGTETLTELGRLMTVCNSCRYCEGLCAVFPAMIARRDFPDGDLNYLANLCHGCGACFYDCQFSPPHEFDVNVPKVMARVRAESYQAYAWPRMFSGLFARNGLVVSIISAFSVALFIGGFAAWNDPAILYGTHTGPGAFYKLMPHNAMVVLFGAVFLYAILATFMGARAFWKEADPSPGTLSDGKSFWQAMKDASKLRYLDGGGGDCLADEDDVPDHRRLYHHFTFYGFLLCFASTSVATLYHYFWGREAPYPWWDLPVVLGTLGGIGLLIGPVGLLRAKWIRDPDMQDKDRFGMDVAFLLMLFLTSLTGLLLLFLRDTPAMGALLAIHLGVVFSLFFTMPYGKFVHGIYRFMALVRYARESGGSA